MRLLLPTTLTILGLVSLTGGLRYGNRGRSLHFAPSLQDKYLDRGVRVVTVDKEFVSEGAEAKVRRRRGLAPTIAPKSSISTLVSFITVVCGLSMAYTTVNNTDYHHNIVC